MRKCDCGRWMTPILSGKERWWCSVCMKGANDVAKKEMSPAEKLAAQIKESGLKRKKAEGPTYYFPENTLEKERTKLGLNVNQAATGAGVSGSHLSGMEKGDNCNLAAAMRVAMFYDRPIEKLFGNVVLDQREKKKEAKVASNATPPTDPLPFEESDHGDPLDYRED